MKFNFQFGKKKKTIKDYAILSIVLFSIVGGLSSCLRIPEKDVWTIIDSIQRLLLKKGIIDDTINDFIINDPKLLDNRVKRNVDRAIEDYIRNEPSMPPRMTNKTILKAIESSRFTDTQRLIVKDAIYYECPGGVMGIRAAWVDKDTNCN